MDPVQSAPPAAARVTDALADVSRLFATSPSFDGVVANVAAEVAAVAGADCLIMLTDATGRHAVRGLAIAPASGGQDAYAALRAHLAASGPPVGDLSPWRELRHGRPAVATGSDEGVDAIWRTCGVGPLMAMPLRDGRDVVGTLVAARPEGAPVFSVTEAMAFGALAAEVGRGLATATLLAEERWQRQKAELMFQASRAIHTELQFDQAVREIALLLKQSIKAPWVGWLELRADRDEFVLLGSTFAPAIDLRLADSACPASAWPEARQAFAAPLRMTQVKLPMSLAAAVASADGTAWLVPLMHKRAGQGLLAVTCPPGEPVFGPESQEVAVAIAELMALALSNHHLIEEEARARMQIIRAQAAAQEREVLLRQIVHDLRNATQAMSLVVEDMELGIGPNPEVQAGLGVLDNQITFISNFLKEKLSWFAQGERPGAGEVARITQVFAALADRFGPAARAKHQSLIVSPPEPVEVSLSSVQLEQVLGNLLDNAIKFTPLHGEVRLRADVSDGWVTVYVTDTGPGIPASVRPHLGEVGTRGNVEVDGAGLGLANVRQLVTRAGGLFGCTSSEATGTTFHVSLPSTLWGRVIS